MAYTATIEEENKEIASRYKDLLKGTYRILTLSDKKEIRKAFELAVEAHSTQRRKTGEPYIYHPIAVAKIVAYEIGLGPTSIIAALLHDVVEDTHYTLEDIEREFGETIARIVNGLTKISRLNKEQDASIQAENFRKMLLTLNDDVRVILIKIADRLHNMQTMDAMPPHKQLKIASETLYIYAPLAHRLGLYNIKTELEDLGLKYTEPEVFNDIQAKITDSKEEQDKYIKTFTGIIKDTLDKEGFEYNIKGRSKSIFSIRRKMRVQNVTYDEIYDKFAIRIIYNSDDKKEKFDAWKIYSIVTDHFQPNPTRLRDWISQPKSTGYESLHITVMGPNSRWVEVQIRSERMDEIAERGYAAHYKYKNSGEKESGLDSWLNRLKETLENPDVNAGDIGLIIIPVAALSTTIIKGDKKGTWQFTKGFLLSQAITLGLKASINKTRPDFSDKNSFPSGHTSTSFQGASFIHKHYGFKYSIPAYTVAGFTAFSRIDSNKHDGIDILARCYRNREYLSLYNTISTRAYGTNI